MRQQSILITGCSSGIGLYCAKQLAKDNYLVVASARNEKDVEQLRKQGLNAVQLDLANENSIQQGLIETLQITDGRLDALFNNGAYGQPGAVEDLPVEALRAQFETNLFGWHSLTCKVLKVMRAQGNGRIIQNSSVLGFVALPYRGAYNASKFALEGLTDTLRLELRDTPIHISLIEPGPIESKFRENAYNAFIKHIDWQNSPHKDNYEKQRIRLESQNAPQKFTLGPEAVYKQLQHALTSVRPKPRYYVTFPTYLMGYLKRLLSSSKLDWFLAKNA